jgi:DivIVA domain-containing protein
MDQDDPEKRIAELERQLTQARSAGNPRGGWLTPEHVRNVAFSTPPRGKRGYNEDQVDQFLDLVEAALRDPTGRTLTAEQVRSMTFSKPPIGKRGYNKDDVDAFLDAVAQQIGRPPEF